MKTLNLDLELKYTFGNLLRQKHVLVVIQNKAGEVLLGYKPHFYPEGIYRLIGGGIDEGEDVIEAAVREVEEEIGLSVGQEDMDLMFKVIVNAKVGNDTFTFTTYICWLQRLVEIEDLSVGDDIQGVKAFNINELNDLINKYESFDENFWYEDGQGYKHLWQDYGKVYAPIHELVHKQLIIDKQLT